MTGREAFLVGCTGADHWHPNSVSSCWLDLRTSALFLYWSHVSVTCFSGDERPYVTETGYPRSQDTAHVVYLDQSCGKRLGLPQWLRGKESTCNAGDTGDVGLISGSRRSPGGGHGNTLQYSCLGNPMG